MNNQQCKECQYYLQHYTLDKRKIFRVYCGHCTLGKAKRKRPDAKACQSFTPRPPQEEAFASREYLSKELIQYMLRLELLPEVKDSEQEIR